MLSEARMGIDLSLKYEYMQNKKNKKVRNIE